jgi:predicted amidophosphoribosyltransferase
VTGCAVCGRPLAEKSAGCRNPLCASAARWFRWNVAVAERTGLLESALNAYKYAGDRSRARVFGTMLAGYLVERRRLLGGFDLVVASPTFVGPGGRDFDHVRMMLAEAALRTVPGDGPPFDLEGVPAIVKTGPTPRLAGRGHAERRRLAAERLRPLLRVPDPRRTAGRRLLVVDDVFTDGRTLDEVARALRLQGGAREVCGLALCRQPWREPAGSPAGAHLQRS